MACTEYEKEYARRWYHANKDRLRVKRREYSRKTSARNVARVAAWRKRYPDKLKKLRKTESHTQRFRETQRAWRAANPERVRAAARKTYHKYEKYKIDNVMNQARRRQAVCAWADETAIEKFYLTARTLSTETGIDYVVDHIIPIKHELVSGLHNEFNLQVLTNSENARKRNHFHIS